VAGRETALELARLVAPDGTVVGVDLSAAVRAFAERAAKGCERFTRTDAQVFPFEPASFDAAFARFGVMFFADPTAAFITIRRSLRPMGDSPSSARGRRRRTCSTSCRSGTPPLICRRNPLPIRTGLPRWRSLTPNAYAAFWKERASGRSRSLPVSSRLEAAISIRCWQPVRGSELQTDVDDKGCWHDVPERRVVRASSRHHGCPSLRNDAGLKGCPPAARLASADLKGQEGVM
jgi:SAM-dependent methyltransferase